MTIEDGFIKRIGIEILVMGALSIVFGLIANAVHPDGIVLARNYFKLGPAEPVADPIPPAPNEVPLPEPNVPEVLPPTPDPPPPPPEVNTPAPPAEPPAATTEDANECITQDESGLSLACFDFVVGAWAALNAGDPSVVFVDARKADAYEEEHIAGAVLIDHYRLERYLPDQIERLLAAQVIVVYCSGSCEDSRFLATALIYDRGVPMEKVFLYEGGVTDWIERKQPINKGAQP
ncbi:rhodanese-like domain-containing protein [Planctomycetota bacterium]